MLHIIEDRAGALVKPATVHKDTGDWFTERVQRSRSGVFSEVVKLTPDLARLLLAGNKKNRVVNNNHVMRLASDMKGGKWALNGEAIIISKDGYLCTGQHRCHAVIVADVPIMTVMTFGVDYDSRTTNDQGMVKTVANYLSMGDAPVANAAICASAARILLIRRLGVDGGSSITKTRIQAEYFANQKAIDTAAAFITGHGVSRVLGGPSMLTAAIVVLRRISPSADDFMLKLIKGNDLSAGDPILVARERFMKEGGMRQSDRMLLIEKAFDAWLDNRKIERIQIKKRIDAGKKLPKGKPGRKS